MRKKKKTGGTIYESDADICQPQADRIPYQGSKGAESYFAGTACGNDRPFRLHISHIENAKRKASLESVIRIVNVLGITVDELLAGVQMNNPAAYQTDIDMLMEDCSENEKRFIYELIKASLETMHKNGWELASSDRHR